MFLSRFLPLSIRKQLVNFKILAAKYGQYRTIKNWECVDAAGKKIPWYTYPAIEYLNNIDFSDKVVFEYGSGNSSIYWSNKAKQVISVEHDEAWYTRGKTGLRHNQQLILKPANQEYEESISAFGMKFDVIIIDGARRNECVEKITPHLNRNSRDGCMVILDNADWYRDCAKKLREELDLIEIDFHGFGPINNYTWTTSIFVSRNFRFKAVDNIQPHLSVAGIHQIGERQC